MTKIYEGKNHILIHTGYGNPVKHSHMAAHIIISMNSVMRVESAGDVYECRGGMIPTGISHMVDTRGDAALVFLYDCTTAVAQQIRCVQCISEESCCRIWNMYAEVEGDGKWARYSEFEKCVLSELGLGESVCCVKDERILEAMNYIRSMRTDRITCKNVADAVCLSQSRFSHLFREQVGMTFAAYLIYQRILHVYAQTIGGKSITEAALEAGFSSSAHFADVNRRIFGLSASNITRDMIFTKEQ